MNYIPGTAKQIEYAYLDGLRELDISITELRISSDKGFQQMTEKLQLHLMQGNAFGSVQQSIEKAFRMNEQLQIEHLNKVGQILTANRIHPTTAQLNIIKNTPLNAMQEPPSHSVIVNMENRLLISGGIGTAGAVTGAIAGKVTAKVAAQGAIKLGAQALVKVATAKVAGALGVTAAGAATGAAVGSVVPGIGTAIGATLGDIVGGVTVGLTIEKLLLMLEETYSRGKFKQQILEAIEESRLEFKTLLESTNP